MDSSGIAYVTGWTYSTNCPTLNQYQTDQGDADAFVTKLSTVSISGRVTIDTATGAGLAGVTVALTNAALSLSTATASDGTYSFGNLPAPATYKIKPALTGYTFSPSDIVLRNVTANQPETNFIARSGSTTEPSTISRVITRLQSCRRDATTR